MFKQCWKKDYQAIILTSLVAGLIPLCSPVVTETIFSDIIPIQDRQGLATVTQVMFMRQPYFLSGLLILAMGQQPNDPGTCVVDTAEGSYLGFDLGLHILYCPKIASLEVGGLRLIWFEEAAQGFEYSFWFGILIAEEHIGGNIFQFCIGVDGQMTFAQQGHNGKVAFFHATNIAEWVIYLETAERIRKIKGKTEIQG